MSLLITCSDYFQNYSSEENFSGQNKPRIVINEKRTRVTRACIHGDMVEICLDHALCLHHDASTYDSYLRLLLTTRTYDSWFWKTLKTNNKKSKALIENWRSLLSPYFWNLPPRKNPTKFEPNYDLQVSRGSQLPLCFIQILMIEIIKI